MSVKKTVNDASISARFVMERETKGAVRYMEVNERGDALEMSDAAIGTLYIRKSAFKGGAVFPNRLVVSIVEG